MGRRVIGAVIAWDRAEGRTSSVSLAPLRRGFPLGRLQPSGEPRQPAPPSAREMIIEQGFPPPYQADKGPGSCCHALCAIIVGDWEEPSGESRLTARSGHGLPTG